MQLTDKSTTILKNFASINPSIVFHKGKKQKTIAPSKTLLAEAVFEDSIEESFSIYDLNSFIAVLTTEKDPIQFDLQGTDLVMTHENGDRLKFRTCVPTMVVSPGEKEIKDTDIAVEFDLSAELLKKIQQYASILSSPNIIFETKGNVIEVMADEVCNDSSHQFTISIKSDKKLKPARSIFRTENWKLLPGDYHVSVLTVGAAKFENKTEKVTYWMAIENPREDKTARS